MKVNKFLFAIMATTGIILSACNDSDNTKNEDTILRPIAQHLSGKWLMTANSSMVNGKWVENENDDNVSMAMEFRPDGSEVRVMTYPDGFTALATTTF